MSFYKNTLGDVFEFESDGSQDDFIPSGLILMSQQEIDAHLTPITPTDYATASKLKLLDYFDGIGLYNELMTIIKSEDKRYQRWLIAGNISIDDPMVAPVRTAMGWTSQQLQDLFNALNAN